MHVAKVAQYGWHLVRGVVDAPDGVRRQDVVRRSCVHDAEHLGRVHARPREYDASSRVFFGELRDVVRDVIDDDPRVRGRVVFFHLLHANEWELAVRLLL